ncbi:hypothetical protein M407DRAFT_181594 [Tulasnella calospora MUT 4182]|uniref:Uncharacterized protein n=1 Tax=Tulasnella calospora MUT 4182 TaxID=1051891 RepID=A0A0C3QCD4_9AGAM|nr:hypothetical protein M407DRAFT_181594 [Tulasnella calospora MUT 4182]
MKDKKAVDAKKAEIKHQLARQGMIRGQAKTPATVPHHQHHHHQRNPSSSSQRTTYLNLPGLQRSTETSVSRRSSASPSPSSNNTIHSGSVPIRTRPERLAKTQAKAALRISPDGTEASGNSDEDEELASGSDDDLRGAHNNRSANTSIDVDHLMASSAGVKDSGKIGGGYSDVPKLFDSSSGRGGPASSTATPSFPNSPLHVSGGLGELDGGFSGERCAFFLSPFFGIEFFSFSPFFFAPRLPLTSLPHYESDRRIFPDSNFD